MANRSRSGSRRRSLFHTQSRRKRGRKGAYRSMVGGRPFVEGGFGCVFRPQLMAKNCDNSNRTQRVSKVMETKDATEEIMEIQKLKSIIKTITHHERYFLVGDINLCEIDHFSDEDLNNYENTCTDMVAKGYTRNVINQESSKSKLRMLTMPFGGISLYDVFRSPLFSCRDLQNLHLKLIDLLDNAIIPMNNLGVYHCDVKASNILAVTETWTLKLIDWGFAITITKEEAKLVLDAKRNHHMMSRTRQSGGGGGGGGGGMSGVSSHQPFHLAQNPHLRVPSRLKNLMFAFNMPLTAALNNDNFVRKFILRNNHLSNYDLAQKTLTTLFFNPKSGFSRRLETLKMDYGLIKTVSKDPSLPPTYLEFCCQRYAEVLGKYRDASGFNHHKFCFSEYIANVDIYGLMSVYLEILIDYNQRPTQQTFHQKLNDYKMKMDHIVKGGHSVTHRKKEELLKGIKSDAEKYKALYATRLRTPEMDKKMQRVIIFVAWVYKHSHMLIDLGEYKRLLHAISFV